MTAAARAPEADGTDLSGQEQMGWNVLTSWAAHLVFIVAGFLMPRLIDRQLGQEALGIWDFGWSVASYFDLAAMGAGASVNRFVARCRGARDAAGLSCVVSSILGMGAASALVACALTAVACNYAPDLLAMRHAPPEQAEAARRVIALLGASMAVKMLLQAYRGVITGCHRWDIHNALTAGFHLASVAGMIVAVSAGGGLVALGLANLAGTVAGEAARVAVARRICPELEVGLRHVSWRKAQEVLRFGAKTLANLFAGLLLAQSSSLIVASAFGPAVLAVYQRPRALLRHADSLVTKFSHVLQPTASFLEARGDREALRTLLVAAGRFGAYVALPLVLGLSILGDRVLALWMGARYDEGALLAVLAVGQALPLTQSPLMMILTGLDAHGRLAVANVVAAVAAAALCAVVIFGFEGGLVGAAVAMTLPVVVTSGIWLPVYSCRLLGVPLRRYAGAFVKPALLVTPFGAALVAIRVLVPAPLPAVAAAVAAGALVLLPLYWRFVLPEFRPPPAAPPKPAEPALAEAAA